MFVLTKTKKSSKFSPFQGKQKSDGEVSKAPLKIGAAGSAKVELVRSTDLFSAQPAKGLGDAAAE